ncbi:MAG: acyl-CoA dehydratase activase-related protein [Dethiobacteria bacterium]
MKKKIGIPRTLSYYTFFPLWKTFFEELGFRVVVSRETNKEVLDQGVKETVNDACIPIKLFHGHVMDLKDRVDYLFIPRLVSADGRSTFCPKFLGLPDMVRFSRPDLPPIIDVRYNIRRGCPSLFSFFCKIGIRVSNNWFKICKGYIKAKAAFKRYLKLLNSGLQPEEALSVMEGKQMEQQNSSGPLKIAVLGYPYIVYDPYISANLLEHLRRMGVQPLTMERIPLKKLRSMAKRLPQNLFWFYSNLVCWAALYYLEEVRDVDGIIHVTAFACGPDAMVDKLIELEAKNHNRMPFLSISIDEHSGEVGVITRLEAFVDMLRRKKEVQT